MSGWKLDEDSRRLYLQGVGHVKFRLHRRLRGTPKTITARRVGRLHRKIGNQRRDFLHKLSRSLVDDHDLIAVEKLPITNMTRRPTPLPDDVGGFAPNGAAAKSGLNQSILDAGWGTLIAMLTYKAEDAGGTSWQ